MNDLAPTRDDNAQPISAEAVDLRTQAGQIDVAATQTDGLGKR